MLKKKDYKFVKLNDLYYDYRVVLDSDKYLIHKIFYKDKRIIFVEDDFVKFNYAKALENYSEEDRELILQAFEKPIIEKVNGEYVEREKRTSDNV
jgi:spore coat protein CotH